MEPCDLCQTETHGSNLRVRLAAETWRDFIADCGKSKGAEDGFIPFYFCAACVFELHGVAPADLLRQALGLSKLVLQ